MAGNNTRTLNDGNFKEAVIDSSTPVLVDFWAEWCGPCRMIAPTVEALASDYAGRVAVGKLNVDENPLTPTQYGVRGIPNLLILKQGQVKEQIVGAVPKARLVEAIERVLA